MKKCTPLWREAHVQVKKLKPLHVRSNFWSWDVEKLHGDVARSKFRSQNVQSTPAPDHFWKLRCRKSARRCRAKHISMSKVQKTEGYGPLLDVQMFVSCGRRKGLCTSSKVSKTWGFCSISKNDGRHGTFEEDPQRCTFRGRCSTKDMFMRDVRRSGRWFLERGCILEHQIFKFAEMILRDRCSTSYDLASLFHGRRSTLDRWTGTIAKRIGPSALHSTFHVWRTSRRIASFLMLSTSKNEEVWQNCFVFEVVIIEEVSQNSFIFKLADRQIDRYTTATTTTSTTTLHYYYNYKYKYTTLHYTTWITLHSTTTTTTTTTATTTMTATLHYTTIRYIIELQHITATNANATRTTTTLPYTTLHYNYNYNSFTLLYARPRNTIPRYSTQHYSTLQYTIYTNYTTPQLQLQLHYTNYTTLQLQLQLTTTTPLHYKYNYTYNYNYCATPLPQLLQLRQTTTTSTTLQLHYTTTTTTTTTTTLQLQHYNFNNFNNINTTTTATRTTTTTTTTTTHYIQELWVRWPLQPLQPLQKEQLQPPFGPPVASLCHPWFTTINLSYWFPISETSATALCGTTGISSSLYSLPLMFHPMVGSTTMVGF